MIDYETIYGWVRDLPIVDWHNHLDLAVLAEDKPLGSLYEVWVKTDPYKHRAMRICGEAERVITGDASEEEKWAAWTRTLPKLVGNPLFAWAEQELAFLRGTGNHRRQGYGGRAGEWGTGNGERGTAAAKAMAVESGNGGWWREVKNVSLAEWTPSKMLKKFNVEYLSPCVGVSESPLLGQRASRPLEVLGRRASRPLELLGQRASRPLEWSACEVKEFPSAQSCVSSHFSHTLASGMFHRRNLPHLGQSSTLVFVTFRLADSLPQAKLDEFAALKEEWLKSHPEPWDESVRREWELSAFPKIEEWLDAGHGSCLLADPVLRKVVEDALEYFNEIGITEDGTGDTGTTGVSPVGEGGDFRNGQDARCPSVRNGQDARCPSVRNGQDARCPSVPRCRRGRYRLHGYVVMPNHVHVLFELFDESDIQKVLHSWKSYTAKKLNKLTGSSGKVWKEEYYDRLIRNG